MLHRGFRPLGQSPPQEVRRSRCQRHAPPAAAACSRPSPKLHNSRPIPSVFVNDDPAKAEPPPCVARKFKSWVGTGLSCASMMRSLRKLCANDAALVISRHNENSWQARSPEARSWRRRTRRIPHSRPQKVSQESSTAALASYPWISRDAGSIQSQFLHRILCVLLESRVIGPSCPVLRRETDTTRDWIRQLRGTGYVGSCVLESPRTKYLTTKSRMHYCPPKGTCDRIVFVAGNAKFITVGIA